MASADQIVDGLKNITAILQPLAEEAQKIAANNLPLMIAGMGPAANILSGLQKAIMVISTQQSFINANEVTGLDTGADSIVAALTGVCLGQSMAPTSLRLRQSFTADKTSGQYVSANEALLTALTSKAGLYKLVPLLQPPYAQTLRVLESSDDGIFFALMDKLPNKKAELQALSDKIDVLQADAVKAFQ